MVKRVTKEWLAEGAHPALEHVFEHIGVTWPIEEREKLFDIASYTAFPSNVRLDAWRGFDHTILTAENKFYYPITASVAATPNVWFKNLRLLQIRKKLNLITSLRVSMFQPSILAGEVLAKTQALEEVVGKHMMSQASVVRMRKPCMMTTRTARIRSANVRAESLRDAGLAARDARN